jgi:hypothetical protein
MSPRMPGLSPIVVLSAAELAVHARPLLSASRTTLLGVTRTSANGTPRLKVSAWNASGRPVDLFCATDYPTAALRRSTTALHAAGALVIDELIRRWPTNAVPPSVGIITDGTGVAFSADHPSPLAHNWLAQQLGGGGRATTLLAFTPSSPWACLTAPVFNTRHH